MTAPPAYWRVRLVLHGALLHLASWTEPRVTRDPATGHLTAIDATWMDDGITGDRLGFVSLPAVTAVTWRRADGRRRVPAESADARRERVWDAITAYVAAHPGTTWKRAETAIGGDAHYARERRDEMLRAGVLVNRGGRSGMELWHRDAAPAMTQRRR